jgi:hypothetical protein
MLKNNHSVMDVSFIRDIWHSVNIVLNLPLTKRTANER